MSNKYGITFIALLPRNRRLTTLIRSRCSRVNCILYLILGKPGRFIMYRRRINGLACQTSTLLIMSLSNVYVCIKRHRASWHPGKIRANIIMINYEPTELMTTPSLRLHRRPRLSKAGTRQQPNCHRQSLPFSMDGQPGSELLNRNRYACSVLLSAQVLSISSVHLPTPWLKRLVSREDEEQYEDGWKRRYTVSREDTTLTCSFTL